ncbi:MAG: GGDEF domain-containing protein [Campylobacterales bacterium]|nr:GGDEF domain-containing protein [Campylobacterales bacterium]
MLNANGEGRAFELTAGHLPDAEDMYMLIFTDITTLQNEKKIFEKLSITDTLTGLYNRRYFNEILDSEISRASQQQSTLSFIICDIDFFKKYNDAYGHQAGDTALSSVAKAINSSINRGTDFAFRLGGEEFGIIFSTSDKEMSLELANKIRTNVEALQIENSKSTVSSCVTISLGLLVVDFSIESVDKNGFYSMADDALYKAKNNGRNQVVLYENGDVENA